MESLPSNIVEIWKRENRKAFPDREKVNPFDYQLDLENNPDWAIWELEMMV